MRNLEVVGAAPVQPSLPGDADDDASPLAALLGAHDEPAISTIGPAPPLPGAAEVSFAAGRVLEADGAAKLHPLARDGRSATFVGADGAMVQIAWVDPSFLQAHRSMPRVLRRDLPGVGDEAYRAVIGGAVVARRGGQVLMVMGRLPRSSDPERDRAFEAIARAAVGPSG